MRTYELNTITVGLSTAPYLAIQCLNQLARNGAHCLPMASKIIQRDFYVDDLITGTPTKHEAIQLRDELIQLLKDGGLHIRQWASNDKFFFF